MSLQTEIAEQQRLFAEASQAMQRFFTEAKKDPSKLPRNDDGSTQYPESFVKAQEAHGETVKELNRLKAIEAQAAEADEACRQALEPVGQPLHAIGGATEPGNGGNGHAETQVLHAVEESRVPRRPSGRNYHLPTQQALKLSEHKAAFNAYLRGGPTRFMLEYNQLAPDVRNALMSSSGELGGFWVPPDFRTEMITDLAAQSILFRLARIIPTTTNEATFPTMLSDPTSPRIYRSGFRGAWRSEGELGVPGSTMPTQNQPRAGQKNIPVHIWEPPAVLITPEQIEDSAFNMEAVVSDVITETLGLEMDSMGLVSGTGNQEPTSIINNLGTDNIVTTSVSGNVDYDAYIDLCFGANGLPSQYRQGAVMVMNTQTYANTLKLNDGADRPLINVFTTPDRIYNYPIEFSEFMAVPAGSAKVVLFGNFINYGIGERTDLRIMRYDQTHPPNITLLARARYGGDVIRKAGFRILQCLA